MSDKQTPNDVAPAEPVIATGTEAEATPSAPTATGADVPWNGARDARDPAQTDHPADAAAKADAVAGTDDPATVATPATTDPNAGVAAGSDPMVIIRDQAEREWMVLTSNFHRLYEQLGYQITRVIGDAEGREEIAPPEYDQTGLPADQRGTVSPAQVATEQALATDAAPVSAPSAPEPATDQTTVPEAGATDATPAPAAEAGGIGAEPATPTLEPATDANVTAPAPDQPAGSEAGRG